MQIQHVLHVRQQQRANRCIACRGAAHPVSSTTVLQRAPILYRYTHNLDARQVAALLLLERDQCTRLLPHAMHDLPPADQLNLLQPRVALALRTSVAVVSAFAPVTRQPSAIDRWLSVARATSNDASTNASTSNDASTDTSRINVDTRLPGEASTRYSSTDSCNELSSTNKDYKELSSTTRGLLQPTAVKARQQQQLVGVAWAYGDASLVATVAAVVACRCTLPRNGEGVAQALLQQLCLQVRRKGGVMDVGTLATPNQHWLYDACFFGPDPEGSTAMILPVGGEALTSKDMLLDSVYTPERIMRHVDVVGLEQRLLAWR